MLALSDEHMQSGPLMDAQQLRVVWEVYHESERLCSRAVLDTAAVTGRAPPPVETVQASLGPTVGTETHTTHPSGPGALTSVHWTRGHVSRGQPVSKFASQRTKKLLNSHCERYLKHCPLRSEFYLAAVGWLTLTCRSSLRSRHNCHRHHCGVRVIPALTVSKWQCSSFSKQIFKRLLTFEAYQGSNLSRVQLKN